MANDAPKRLAPALRKAGLLAAAMNLLNRDGLDGFSLEAVAREAGVAATLPRHYFGSSSELLKTATKDVLRDVEKLLLSKDLHLKLESRLATYLDILHKQPWAHRVWTRSAELHPDIGALVRRARRRMAEDMYGRPWKDLSEQQQLEALGKIGFIEAVVTECLDRGMANTEVAVKVLMAAFRRQPT